MIAVDTNVLVYGLDALEPAKQAIAIQLIDELTAGSDTVLLWQVAGELLRQLTRWQDQKLVDQAFVEDSFRAVRTFFPLVIPSESCLDHAIALKKKYSLQHWDSMLLGACIDAGISVLYTEDMGAPRQIESLELVDPFKT